MLRTWVLSAGCFCLLSTITAQSIDSCPPRLQSYNATGLLGIFDSLLTDPIPPDTDSYKPKVDNDGFLYSDDQDAPAPPASFAYALVLSERDDVNYSAVVSTLLAAAPLNASTSQPRRNSSGVACALTMLDLPTRTLRLGQDDDGTCTSTFPNGCARKMVQMIADHPMTWPNADSNMTRLEKMCAGYADVLKSMINYDQRQASELPDECTMLFAEDADNDDEDSLRFVSDVVSSPLTANDTEAINEVLPFTCEHLDVVDDTLGQAYVSYPFWNETPAVDTQDIEGSFTRNYNKAAQQVYPIVTLLLRDPLQGTGDEDVRLLSAHLGCVRRTQYTEGSVRAPELRGLGAGSGLSGGAIAGVVIGVLIAVALSAVLLWWFCFRGKRRSRRQGGPSAPRKSGEKYEMIDR